MDFVDIDIFIEYCFGKKVFPKLDHIFNSNELSFELDIMISN